MTWEQFRLLFITGSILCFTINFIIYLNGKRIEQPGVKEIIFLIISPAIPLLIFYDTCTMERWVSSNLYTIQEWLFADWFIMYLGELSRMGIT